MKRLKTIFLLLILLVPLSLINCGGDSEEGGTPTGGTTTTGGTTGGGGTTTTSNSCSTDGSSEEVNREYTAFVDLGSSERYQAKLFIEADECYYCSESQDADDSDRSLTSDGTWRSEFGTTGGSLDGTIDIYIGTEATPSYTVSADGLTLESNDADASYPKQTTAIFDCENF